MKRMFTALAVATTLAAAALPAIAQEGAAEMTEALTMLETSAERILSQHGITDVDVMSLTLSQLAGIRAAVSSDDDEGLMEQRLRTIVSGG